ncbi:TerD family protein [Nocardia gamkensis]|uniref:TerD family protein n=1 Tax=Nocardia gamkensis TaxID=352869 RepID=UPI0037C59268
MPRTYLYGIFTSGAPGSLVGNPISPLEIGQSDDLEGAVLEHYGGAAAVTDRCAGRYGFADARLGRRPASRPAGGRSSTLSSDARRTLTASCAAICRNRARHTPPTGGRPLLRLPGSPAQPIHDGALCSRRIRDPVEVKTLSAPGAASMHIAGELVRDRTRKKHRMTATDPHRTRLEHLRVALGWDPVRRSRFAFTAKDIDLNVSAVLFADEHIGDVVYHQQLSSRDGSVRHLGDSTTGEGKGDNEVITIDLTRIPDRITTVVVLVTSYTGQTFDQIENAFCRVVDTVSGTEIAHHDLDANPSHTGFVMGKVSRAQGTWQFQSIGEAISAQHPVEAIPQITRFLT